jgi:PadR family transcriptional regulator PadR
MARPRADSPHTLAVFRELLAEPERWRYGYELAKATGLASGTLYPILMRLEERELLEARWELAERKPRHMYRLTPDGFAYVAARVGAPAPVLTQEAVA